MSELTFESVLELISENSRQTRLLIAEGSAESRKLIDELTKSMKAGIKEVNKKLAELGDTLGRFAEEQVKADIVSKFEKWEIPVHTYGTHFVQTVTKNNFVYEVDILIYNTDYIIVLEVKNQLKKNDIDEHIERMKLLQKYPLPDSKGKTLLAGIGSMIISDRLDKYAESNKGLFVIKPSGENIKIANNKKTFKPIEWKVAS